MTAAVVFVFVALTFFVSPYVGARYERHRQRVRELTRCGGPVRYTRGMAPGFGERPTIPPPPKSTATPHWTRDPSPRARASR